MMKQAQEGAEHPRPSVLFEVGEQVRVSEGPFASFNGAVEDIDEDMELLQPLLAQMVSPREALDGFRYSTLGAAIKKVWKAKGRAMTITDIHALLATGMQLFFAESLDTFAQDMRRARPTFFFSVPRLWVKFKEGVDAKMPPAKLARMLKIPIVRGLVRKKVLTTLGLDQCRFAAGGAAPMPADLLRWYTALGLDIVEIYGMTENCGVSHTTLPGKSRPGTVGLNFPGVQCRLAPADSEIQMKSNMLMLGYFKEPQLSQEALTADGWLRTGDKGAMDAEGNLKITGRVKDLFKTNKGKYVAPAPIEDKLALTPGVEACCVVGSNLGQPLALLMLSMLAAKQSLEAEHRRSLEAGIAAKLAKRLIDDYRAKNRTDLFGPEPGAASRANGRTSGKPQARLFGLYQGFRRPKDHRLTRAERQPHRGCGQSRSGGRRPRGW